MDDRHPREKHEASFRSADTVILYDPQAVDVVSPDWLQPRFWRQRNAVLGTLGGRGQALAVATEAGPAVLRRYCRGGQAARISRDRYVFLGYERSRSLREWRVMRRLRELGLPVPRPLMASCERAGVTYRAGLLTALIPDARSLAEAGAGLTAADWRSLADTLARLFSAGVVHADLNAHNLLLDRIGCWYVIDFDRARIQPGPADPAPMIRRLQRSMAKMGIRAGRDWLERFSTRA